MRIWKGFLAFALCASATPVLADVINFDDLPPGSGDFIPSPYAGFNWNNFAYSQYGLPGTGYSNGLVSPPNYAFNAFGEDASVTAATGPFTFSGGQFTSAWRDDLQLVITGYQGTTAVDTATLDLQVGGPFQFMTDWTNLDSLTFAASGGTQHPGLFGNSTAFVLDDLVMGNAAAVPEPATWALMLVGFMLIGFAQRRSGLAVPLVFKLRDTAPLVATA